MCLFANDMSERSKVRLLTCNWSFDSEKFASMPECWVEEQPKAGLLLFVRTTTKKVLDDGTKNGFKLNAMQSAT